MRGLCVVTILILSFSLAVPATAQTRGPRGTSAAAAATAQVAHEVPAQAGTSAATCLL